MDLLNTFLNFLLPPLSLLSFFLFLPFYLLFRVLRCLQRYRKIENVAGKVVLITGASSGIGEHLAYEYARKGARLALTARREDRLQAVAANCRTLGSPDVIVIAGDVSNVDDCKRFVLETVHHFGQLDHLVNNAGVSQKTLFEDFTRISDSFPIMNINFWGSVYCTHFATPYLRKSKGKIVAITSAAAKIPVPIASIYTASKAAILGFFEALRIELSPDVGVITVLPGLISTDMTTPEFIEKYGADSPISESANKCAKAIVDGVCGGMRCIVEPSWVNTLFWTKNLYPEVMEWGLQYTFTHHIKPSLKKD